MPHSDLKKLAKNMVVRNPDMNYTTALREVAHAPVIRKPHDNLLVYATPGHGAPYVMLWQTADLHQRTGYPITIFSPDPLSQWFNNRADLVWTYDEHRYADELMKLEAGIPEQPKIVALMYYCTDFTSEVLMKKMKLLLDDPNTIVILHSSDMDSIKTLTDLFPNKLIMGRIDQEASMLFFPLMDGGEMSFETGTGVLISEGGSKQVFRVPFDRTLLYDG